jgi:hypothetical protein
MNRHILCKLCIAFILMLSVSSSHAQELIRQQSCVNEAFRPQIDSLKHLYSTQGYEVVREASMTMESEYEMPVIVPLNQGSWYQFVFIGDPSSKLYEVRMFDWNEKQVVYKKNMWGDVDGNVISYNYVCGFSEYHMLKAVQVNKNKKKDLCGYVMMFKKTSQGGEVQGK